MVAMCKERDEAAENVMICIYLLVRAGSCGQSLKNTGIDWVVKRCAEKEEVVDCTGVAKKEEVCGLGNGTRGMTKIDPDLDNEYRRVSSTVARNFHAA